MGMDRTAVPRASLTKKKTSRFKHATSTRQTPEIFMFALLPMEAFTIAGFPVSELVAVLIVVRGLFRVRLVRISYGWITLLLAIVIWCLTSSLLADSALDFRRLGHIALWALLIFVISSGRIQYASMVQGLGLGVAAAALSGLLGFRILSGYEGRLTGLFGEPNVAGLVLLAYGLVAITTIQNRGWTLILVLLAIAALGMTFSRTSWLALIIGVVWFVIGSRVTPLLGIPITTAFYWLAATTAESFQNWGPFASRTGSDMLRERIIKQELAYIDQSPLIGHGAGTAHVLVDGLSFFFHNSLYAIQAEFGLVGLVLISALVSLIFLKLLVLPRTQRNRVLEMSIIGVMICALHLGEVLLSLEVAVVIGAALYWVSSTHMPFVTNEVPRFRRIAERNER